MPCSSPAQSANRIVRFGRTPVAARIRAASMIIAEPAALSAAVKVTPALVVAALLNRQARRWFALPVVVVGAVLTLLGVLVSPRSAVSYFGGLLWDSARVAAPGTMTNNSLAGAFAHAGVPTWPSLVLSVPLLVVVAVVVVTAAHAVAVRRAAGRTGREAR